MSYLGSSQHLIPSYLVSSLFICTTLQGKPHGAPTYSKFDKKKSLIKLFKTHKKFSSWTGKNNERLLFVPSLSVWRRPRYQAGMQGKD